MATILPFIRSETAFDNSTTQIMGVAFGAACAEFREADLTKLTREIIAAQIIQAAKRGERDPARLCRSLFPPLGAGKSPTARRRIRKVILNYCTVERASDLCTVACVRLSGLDRATGRGRLFPGPFRWSISTRRNDNLS